MAADETYFLANASYDIWVDTEVRTKLNMQSCPDCLNEEPYKQPGIKRPPAQTIKKHRSTSKADPNGFTVIYPFVFEKAIPPYPQIIISLCTFP